MIEVHRVDLDHAVDGHLSADEIERAGRYRVEHGRRAFVACRSTLREVLGTRLGIAPADVVFETSDHGRPTLPGGEVSFNVAHSGAIGLIAVAAGDRRLGVDVEQIDARTESETLAARFFHPAEVTAIAGRREAFFRCWTRKEAVVKALGTGLSHPLESFAVEVDGGAATAVTGVEAMSVCGLQVGEGYAAALAADGELEYAWAS